MASVAITGQAERSQATSKAMAGHVREFTDSPPDGDKAGRKFVKECPCFERN